MKRASHKYVDTASLSYFSESSQNNTIEEEEEQQQEKKRFIKEKPTLSALQPKGAYKGTGPDIRHQISYRKC